jgi:hypothetical protein
MTVLLYFLIPIAILATVAALGAGIYAMGKGGAYSKEHSNKLMRLRIMAQAIAIALMMLLLFLVGQGD